MDDERNVFVSVGATATNEQEDFVCAVEDRLRAEGLTPHTVGRNTFSADAPLVAVKQLLDRCSGTVVIALERSYFPAGVDKRGGPKETALSTVKLPTPWNQIEAAIAYSLGRPLMIILETGLKNEGLLQQGYDWYVQEVKLERAALASAEFNGVFASWKQKVLQMKLPGSTPADRPRIDFQTMSILDLVKALNPAQLWGVLCALAAALAGAFTLGAKFLGNAGH